MRLAAAKYLPKLQKQTIAGIQCAHGRQLFANPVERPAANSARSRFETQGDYADASPPPCDILLSFLRECTQKKDLTNTKRLHHFIVSNGFQFHSFWADHLIQLLALFGSLQESIQAFHRVLHPTLHTWHAIIAAHIKHGECNRALYLYCTMLQAAITPDRVTFLHVLQACSSGSSPFFGMMVHDQMIRISLDLDTSVVNTLIDMYAKCAYIDEARCVFDQLPSKTVVSWGAMIGGYAKNGQRDQAFDLLKKMQQKKVKVNNITISCILKACDTTGALEQGRCVHILATMGGHEPNLLVTRALITMYISCNSLGDARIVFDQMKHVDLKSWGIITAGYSQNGLGVAAFQLFTKLQQKGLRPDRVILLCMPQACQSTGSSKEGKLVHEQIIKEGFETHISMGNALIDMYVMCGSLEDARNVFDGLETKDVVSWAAMISGYVQHDHICVALELFSSMQQRGLEPDEVTFLWLLKACGKLRCLGQGFSLHNGILQKGFDLDISISGSLIDMYNGCGSVEEALFIFNRVSNPNIVLWGAMISGYVQHGHDLLALEFFRRMQKQDLEPDIALCTSLLTACSRTGAIDEGRLLHNYSKGHGAKLTTTVANSVIDMYSKCGFVMEAFKLFESLPVKDVSCWGAMIAAYLESNCIHPAFALFEKMLQEGLHPDKTLFLQLCKACGQIRATEWGNMVYDLLMKAGFDSCLVVGSALIDMYARCACLREAENVFSNLPNPDIVCWGALLAGYMHCGYALVVLDLFNRMIDTGSEADRALFLSALKACGAAGCLEQGRVLHLHIVDSNLEQDALVVSALVDMYGKCGSFEDGQSLLDKLQHSSELPCGAMISGYVLHGYGVPALELFEAMQEQGVKAGKATFLCTLKACSNIGAIDQGRFIHNQVVSNNLEADLAVGNTLIDMYSKCGSPNEAYKVFEGLSDKDVVSWSATISAYAAHGNWEAVFELLKSMQNHDIQPDDPLFISVLSACSQNGLLNEGCQQFGQMKGECLLSPRIDHYNCMVDIFGRGGNLSEAEDMLKTMPLAPNLVSWLSLLSGCRVYGNKGLGGQCLEESKELDSSNASSDTQLSNFCANSGQSPKVHAGVLDWSQCMNGACLEVDDQVHEFLVKNSYELGGEVYAKLRTSYSLKEEGYASSVNKVSEPTGGFSCSLDIKLRDSNAGLGLYNYSAGRYPFSMSGLTINSTSG